MTCSILAGPLVSQRAGGGAHLGELGLLKRRGEQRALEVLERRALLAQRHAPPPAACPRGAQRE